MDIGVIGGSDGPTTIYLASGISPYTIATLVIVCIALVVIIHLTIRKRKSKQPTK